MCLMTIQKLNSVLLLHWRIPPIIVSLYLITTKLAKIVTKEHYVYKKLTKAPSEEGAFAVFLVFHGYFISVYVCASAAAFYSNL